MISTFDSFDDATAACNGRQTVCGAVDADGEIVYWLAPFDADAEQMEDIAFEAKNGRPIGPDERSFREMLKERNPDVLSASWDDIEAMVEK